jgi:septum formation protein
MMESLKDLLKGKQLILGTKSPRRHHLMEQLGVPFSILSKQVDENGPAGLSGTELACYLSELKSSAFSKELLNPNNIVLTADTVVWLEGRSLAKPAGYEEAGNMLRLLSGRKHQVITGVTLANAEQRSTFFAVTNVWFKKLSESEIDFYVREYKPFDKAGAYGVQEWIGIIGIERIEGSYYNVVGLPVKQVYEELIKFIPNTGKR